MTVPPPVASGTSGPDTPAPAGGSVDPPESAPRGLGARWALPVWGWLVLGAVVVVALALAIVTRPNDDSADMSMLRAQLDAKDAQLLQAQADAQQDAFDDVQEVRDEAEQQLSAAASAREQAEQSAELAGTKYADMITFETSRVQVEALAAACTAADAAGYGQGARPDPTTFGPAAAAGLPLDASTQVLAALDNTAIEAKVDECYQTGSERYLSQTTTTTTTTTVPPAPPVEDPGSVPVGQTPS